MDVLQHSFTSDTSFQEEIVEAPNLDSRGGGGGAQEVGDQLQCLDHAFFITEVQRLLNDAERRHRQLWQEGKSHRVSVWEQQQLETVEGVVAELRNHKRKLQALLLFDPHATLQDLYRLQDLLQDSWRGVPAAFATSARSPVRYSADDADQALADSDDEDLYDDMSNMKIGKATNGKKKGGAGNGQRQSKSKARSPANKTGTQKNRKGMIFN